MKTKRIEWSYPTSPNAVRLGFGKSGCWTVEVVNGATHKATAISGSTSYDLAKQTAEARPEPWDKLTR